MAVQLDDYFELDGVGDSLTIPDTNRLEADTAHLEQGMGQWAVFGTGYGAQPELIESPVGVPAGTIGTKVLKVINAAQGSEFTSRASAYKIAADELTDYASGYWVYIDSAAADWTTDITFRVGFEYFDADTYKGGSYAEPNETVPGQQWVWVTGLHEETVAGVDGVTLYVRWPDTLPTDTVCYIAAAHLEQTSEDSPTFLPSLRIIGDLELEMDFTLPDDFTPAANEGIFGTWYYNNGGWMLRNVTADGLNIAITSAAGTNRYITQTAAALGITGREGERVTLKFTLDISDTATGAVWTIDGVETTGGHAMTDIGPAIASNGLALPANDSTLYSGNVFTATVRDGIGGPAVATYRPEDVNA